MDKLCVKVKMLTSIWTGSGDGSMDRIHETGILKSLRWWFEAIVRGLEDMRVIQRGMTNTSMILKTNALLRSSFVLFVIFWCNKLAAVVSVEDSR